MVRTCWSEMVAAIITTTTTNDGEHREGCMMTNILMDRPVAAQSAADRPGSLEMLSAVSAVAAAAELVENEPSRLCQ